ncbi:hypothetical protein ACFL6U_10050 [Planctomycetota bacterium]
MVKQTPFAGTANLCVHPKNLRPKNTLFERQLKLLCDLSDLRVRKENN